MSDSPGGPWWKERTVGDGEGVSLALGPLDLAILRSPGEWRVASRTVDHGQERNRAALQSISELSEDTGETERYASGRDRDSLRLTPRTADRAVVVRPRIPLLVPSGERIRIFVSAPIWVEVSIGRPWRSLCERPVKRLTDTWFGPSTLEGELAYALRTHARIGSDDLPFHHGRATTPVVVMNRGQDTLAIERFSLPVPYLSLYADPEQRLWTEQVTMSRTEEDHMAEFKVGRGAPVDQPDASRVSGPRMVAHDNLLVRAFATLVKRVAGDDE